MKRTTLTAEQFKALSSKPRKKRKSKAEYAATFAAIPKRTTAETAALPAQRAMFTRHEPLTTCWRSPMPPTVNHYQPHAVRNGKLVRHFSNEGVAFKIAVQNSWYAHWNQSPPKPTTARLRLFILVCYNTAAAIDLDNRVKPLQDALTGLAWKDDEQIDELHVRRGPISREGAYCEVWIDIVPRAAIMKTC